MGNITKFLKLAFSMIVFIVGICYLMYGMKTYHQAVSQLRINLKDSDVLYQQYVSEEKFVPYAELIATLFQPPEYDIEINGVTIKRQEHIAEKILSYGINHVEYQKTYEYDNKGNIVKIIFTEHE